MFKSKQAAALYYAEKGFEVLHLWFMEDGHCACPEKGACEHPAKHPIASNGLDSSSKETETIERHWTAYPDANIGIRTGQGSIVALDVDGENGKKSLRKLEKKYGKLPETVKVITSNGFHLYFNAPEMEIKSTAGVIAENIDIRADRAYLIAPGSIHKSGVPYKFAEGLSLEDIELADMPDRLIELTKKEPASAKKKAKNIKNSHIIDGGSIPEGRRNSTLASIAGRYRHQGYEYPELLKLLEHYNTKQCRPPLPSKEVEGIARSISSYAPGGGVYDTAEEDSEISDILENLPEKPGDALSALLGNDTVLESLVRLSKDSPQKYELFLLKLKKRGATTRDIDSIKRAVKAVANASMEQSPSLAVPVLVLLPTAPVPIEYSVPEGYLILESGIFKKIITNKDDLNKQIATAPVLIIKRFKALDGQEHLSLTWYRDGNWQTIVVERGLIADRNKILALADRGFPVNSSTGKDIVEYLCLLEDLNLPLMPISKLTKQLGWQGKGGAHGFIMHRFLPMDGSKSRSCTPGSMDEETICFAPGSAGELQAFTAIGVKGSYPKWKKTAELLQDYPVVSFMVYAALAAPLLEILNLPTFIVDLSGVTSSGKTTVLRYASSVWGNPFGGGLVRSWNMTKVFAERSLSTLNGIPLFLDDTKQIQHPDVISKIIYEASFGQGRGRGNIQGTESTSSWRTVILSTGESKITDIANKSDGGIHARVIPVGMAPYGKTSRGINGVINHVDGIIQTSYGHPGWRFVRFLIRNKDAWPEWRKQHRLITKKYQKYAGNSGVGLRVCESFAVIELAAVIAQDALKLGWDYKDHLKTVFDHIIADVKRAADQPAEALRHVLGVAVSKKDHFWPSTLNQQPVSGWVGTWPEGGNLTFIPGNLREILSREGYEPNSILKQWRAKKWLKISESSGLTSKVKIGGQRVRCYVIKAKFVDKFM